MDLVDLHTEAWREAFLAFGKDIPFGAIRAQIGKGGDQLLPVFWSRGELEKIEKPLTDFRSGLFKEKFLPRVIGFPKVRELFQQLLRDGKRLALASSAKQDELAVYKRIARIDDLVETESSSDDAKASKPHPDIFETALEKLGPPDARGVQGSRRYPYDIEAAAKAGLRTIAVRTGGFPEETLKDAVAIYDSPADLLAHLDASPLRATA